MMQQGAPLMVDIMVAAMRCGLTNVGTFEMGDLPFKTGYDAFLNPPMSFAEGHGLHHHARDVGPQGVYSGQHADWLKTITVNRQYRFQLLAKMLTDLKNTPEPGGDMLFNSLVMTNSEFSNGSIHGVVDLPILLAGGAGGRLAGNRHVNFNSRAAVDPNTREYQSRESIHNLYTWILNAFDYPDTHFGSSGDALYEGPLTL
jgi:hypothetical protein